MTNALAIACVGTGAQPWMRKPNVCLHELPSRLRPGLFSGD